jgi:hypothetical protein
VPAPQAGSRRRVLSYGFSIEGDKNHQEAEAGVDRRGKEHYAEAADHGIEGIGWKRQMVRKGDVKLCILQPKTLSVARRR